MGRVRQGVEGEAGLFTYLLSYLLLFIYLLINFFSPTHGCIIICYRATRKGLQPDSLVLEVIKAQASIH